MSYLCFEYTCKLLQIDKARSNSVKVMTV